MFGNLQKHNLFQILPPGEQSCLKSVKRLFLAIAQADLLEKKTFIIYKLPLRLNETHLEN